MKTKQLMLGVIALNLIGVGILVLSRRSVPDASQLQGSQLEIGQPASHTDDGLRADQPQLVVRIPPRPVAETLPAATDIAAQISQLRGQAFDAAELAVNRTNNNPQALCLLGKLHLRNNDQAGAKLLWEQALQIDSNCAEAYVDLGHLSEKQGNLEQSEKFFIKAIETSPQLVDAYEPLAAAQLQLGKFEEAAARLKQFLALKPTSVSGWCSLGKAQHDMGQYELAVASFRRALEIEENSQEAVLGLMNAYRSLGDKANATANAAVLAQIVAAQPRVAEQRDVVARDVDKMQSLLVFTTQTAANLLAQAGHIDEAVDQIEKTLNSVSDAPELRTQLSQIYLAQGAVDRAIRVLRVGAEAKPDDPFGWMELGLLCIRCRRLDAAEDALRRVIELAPTSDRAYALLAQTQMPEGRDQRAAVESARRAVDIAPTAGNHYILATAYYNAGDIESTKSELRIAVSMAPDESEYRDALRRIE